MKEFKITRYIKKLLPLIIVASVLLTIGVNRFLVSRQTYYAQAVIRYEGDNPKNGLTPSGETLDVSEIKSSAVMARVIDNLGLRYFSIDDLISRTKTWEVIDEDEQALKDAMLEDGKEYTIKPVTYIVSFEARSYEGLALARSILDEILDVYFEMYSEKYVNVSSTSNSIGEIFENHFDYLEMTEAISEQISSTLETLAIRYKNNDGFRSAETGKSFLDFYNELSVIKESKLSVINAEILQYQITRNKESLVAKYTERIRQNNLSVNEDGEKLKDALELINKYVKKMKESGNANITSDYILDQIYGDKDGLIATDQTVTYDKLMYSWRDLNESQQHAAVDTAYSEYIIGVFDECREGTKQCSSDATHTCSSVTVADYDKIVSNVESEIKELISTLNEIYDDIDVSNDEFNRFLGASNISTLSSVTVSEGINVRLYSLIAAVFFLIVCSCGAILLGRIGDIVNYAFYTDHLVGFNNRSAFDGYLKRKEKKILGDGTACVIVNLCNRREINEDAGRNMCDRVIVLISEMLREELGKLDPFFVYNGNGQFIVMINNTDAVTVEYIMKHFELLLDNREVYTEGEIVCEIGVAECSKDSVRSARGLLTKAYESKIQYVSRVKKEPEEK